MSRRFGASEPIPPTTDRGFSRLDHAFWPGFGYCEVGMTDDLDLLRAWRSGDRDAGTKLFRRHVDSVFRFFHSKLTTDVDDLVQRTFLACVEAGDRLDKIRTFKAYLLGIARYQLLRYLEEKGRGKRWRDLADVSVDSVTGPSKMMARREEQRVLFDALRRLPVDLQITLELFYWEQMPMLDIAAVTEVPEGTVKSRLFRGRKLLRERLLETRESPELIESTLNDLEGWARSLREQLVRPANSSDDVSVG